MVIDGFANLALVHMMASDKMSPISFVYTGYYYLYADSGLSSRPNFSAWASCTLAAIFYVFAILLIVGEVYETRFGADSFPFGVIAIACGIAIAWLSDWKIQHTWFGAREVDLLGNDRTLAKIVALGLMLGSWLCFIIIGLVLY